jgi:serine/threonine protein kinase
VTKISARPTAFSLERIGLKLQALSVVSTDSCLTDESIFAFVQGQLPPDAVPTIEEHLSLCQDCRSVVAETAKFFADDDTAEADGPVSGRAASDAAADARVSGRAAFGASADDQDDDPRVPLGPGTRVSRYMISDVIGVGAAGVVYRAYDPELKRNIALKLLRTDHARERGPLKARLLREAQAMAQLSHPNVVSVYDVGTYGDEIVIVLELVEGQTLARWLSERPRSWQEIRSAFIEAGRGLAAAHAVQLVHRDFKPANVLVGTDGRVRVTDFGLARPMDLDDDANAPRDARIGEGDAPSDAQGPLSSARSRAPLFSMTATEEGGLAGTPVYMAPEQFRRCRADARSDQFSFCVALYMALYRRHPFLVGTNKVDSLEQLADSLTRGALQVPDRSDVPAALFQILRRGLEVDPKERFSSMQELLDQLVSEPATPATPRAPRRRPAVVVGVALAALVGASFLAMSAPSREPAPPPKQAVVLPTSSAPAVEIAAPIEAAPEPAPVATPALSAVTPQRRSRPAHTQDTKARRPPPPPGRERYVDGLKDPF